jgi:hypothetical protein
MAHAIFAAHIGDMRTTRMRIDSPAGLRHAHVDAEHVAVVLVLHESGGHLVIRWM